MEPKFWLENEKKSNLLVYFPELKTTALYSFDILRHVILPLYISIFLISVFALFLFIGPECTNLSNVSLQWWLQMVVRAWNKLNTLGKSSTLWLSIQD